MTINVGKILVNDKERDLLINWDRQLKSDQSEKLKDIFQATIVEMCINGLDTSQINKVNYSGIYNEKNESLMTRELEAAWADFWGDLMDYAEEVAPGPTDGNRADGPYTSDTMDAEFKWLDDERPELALLKKEIKDPKIEDPLIERIQNGNVRAKLALDLSVIPRKTVYEATAKFPGSKIPTLKVREVWPHNSRYCENGITPSMDEVATPTNLRQGEDGLDFSSNYYTGRVNNLPAAVEQAEFIFRSEFVKNLDVQKGITFDPKTKTYTCTYAVQSLLATGLGEMDKYKAAAKAYKALSEKEAITLEVLDSNGELKIVNVKFNPIGPASTSINQCVAAPIHKYRVNQEFIEKCKVLANNLKKDETAKVNEAIKRLESYQWNPFTSNWKEVMLRAHVCHLLNIPQVVHCKSSKDRTGFAIAMITAMKQYLKYVKEVEGDILEIVKTNEFKDFFKLNLMLGVKMTQIGNLKKGYQFNFLPRIRGIKALDAILPQQHELDNEREDFLTDRGLVAGVERKVPNLAHNLRKLAPSRQVATNSRRVPVFLS